MMRYAIFSDIHSNLEAFDAVIEAFTSESPDKYLCVGDIVGYAANPDECILRVKELRTDAVAGNHDWASAGLLAISYFNESAAKAVLWTSCRLSRESAQFLKSLGLVYKNEHLTLVHGSLDNPGQFYYIMDGAVSLRTFGLLQTDVCFIGHTHVPGAFIRDKSGNIYYLQDQEFKIEPDARYIVNVGSVGQPRDGNPKASFCVYDTDSKIVSIKRIPYDYEKARKKIIEMGLPRYLGDRLLEGR